MAIGNSRLIEKVKIVMLRGEKGDSPDITETPIDNGHRVTFSYPDGEDVSFDVHNATSGDYSGLTNKPSINDVIVSGDKDSSDYGIAVGVITIADDITDVSAGSINSGSIAVSDMGIPAGYIPIGIVGYDAKTNSNPNPAHNPKVSIQTARMIFNNDGMPTRIAYYVSNIDTVAYATVYAMFNVLCVKAGLWTPL